MRKRRIVHGASFNLISNFPQHVVAEPLPFRKRVYLFEKGQRARPLLPSASAVSARST
jgi:hypothetical protein